MLRRWAPVILIALAACRQPTPAPPPPAKATPPPTTRADVTVHHFDLQKGFLTVDVLVPTAFPAPRPAVVTLLGEDDAFLDTGLAVVKYTIHWELMPKFGKSPPKNTVGKWLLAAPTPATIGEGYFRLMAGNAESTIPQVLDTAVTLPDVDARRIGIAGTSTNGFTALMALGADRRLTTGVVIAACGDFHRFLHESTLAMEGAPLALDPTYESWLDTKEPIRHAERFVHAALLMVNGDADDVIPYSCARETDRTFRRAYRKAGASRRFRFVVGKGAGHDVADRAHHETMTWLQRWLLGDRRHAPR
jgi:dienelactone hydrolase